MWRDELRECIRDSGRNISEISRECRIDRKTVRRALNGDNVNVEALEKILDALDMRLTIVDKGWWDYDD